MFYRLLSFTQFAFHSVYSALTERHILTKETFSIPKNVQPRLKPERDQRIPRIIHQTHESCEQGGAIYNLTRQLININPTYEYRFYDALDRESFLIEKYGKESSIFQAYENLTHGTAKSDLFRLAVLASEGGLYLDTKSSAIEPFDSVIPIDSDFVSLKDLSDRAIATGSLIGCVPDNTLSKRILFKAVENVLSKNYGENPLDVAGPYTAGRIVVDFVGEDSLQPKRYTVGALNIDLVGRVLFFRTYSVLNNGIPFLIRCPSNYYTSLSFLLSRYEWAWILGKYFN